MDVHSGAKMKYDRVLMVDAATYPRVGEVASLVAADALIVNVDHHDDNTNFGKINIVRPKAASTTEILFDFCEALDLLISADLATQLYTGLMTDTGGFRYSNTSVHSFETAARLVELGAEPNVIAEAVYASNSPAGMKLLSAALGSLELASQGRIATMTIEPEDGWEEAEDLADYPLKVRGVRASALFRLKNGTVRVSLRGRGHINVSEIARRFGGGGHLKAAGFTIQGDLEEIRAQVIELLRREVEHRIPHAT
jgi:phosphoesterase RecJ-like protein